jgi:sulfide:quinone oxidoreductase
MILPQPPVMTDQLTDDAKLRVIIAGGGVAGLEAALALADLAPDRTDVTLIAPNADFVYRPMTVGEPFAYGAALRYPLGRIVADAGATLVTDALAWVEPAKQLVHTESGENLSYDALILALGAVAHPLYEHAVTIDDRRMDEVLHGLVQDIEGGYVHSLAFVSPGRMAWPLPLYELALMSAARAYEMNVELSIALVTPEDAPLAIFGANASDAVSALLERAGVRTLTSAYAEIPEAGHVVISPGDRSLRVDRVVALPELYGPAIRGLPVAEHGFVRVDRHARVPASGPVFAAGDAVDFAVKQGGISSQQADAAAQSVAALAGAAITPESFDPVVRGMLLTGDKPVYLTARITGGHGFSSEITDKPSWSGGGKIAAKYLAPYLDAIDHDKTPG